MTRILSRGLIIIIPNTRAPVAPQNSAHWAQIRAVNGKSNISVRVCNLEQSLQASEKFWSQM